MLPKYEYLLTYRFAEIIYDLTVEFCNLYINKFSRTHDQMVQAARSGKQNIVEGVEGGRTSKKSEIKLLGVSYASYEELIQDYGDFLRERKLTLWEKSDPRVRAFRDLGISLTKLPRQPMVLKLPSLPEEAANLLLTFCHQETYLLSRQIAASEEKFVREGGFTENLYAKRVAFRDSSKSPK